MQRFFAQGLRLGLTGLNHLGEQITQFGWSRYGCDVQRLYFWSLWHRQVFRYRNSGNRRLRHDRRHQYVWGFYKHWGLRSFNDLRKLCDWGSVWNFLAH